MYFCEISLNQKQFQPYLVQTKKALQFEPKQPDGELVHFMHVADQVCFPQSWQRGDTTDRVNMSLIICQFALLMTETVTIKVIKKLSKQ